MRSLLSLFLSQRVLLSPLLLFLLVTGSAYAEPLQLTPDEQTWLRAHPVVRARISSTYPPFEFYENNTFKGMAYDYVQLIAGRLGIRVEPVTGISWPEALDQLKSRSGVDLIVLITKDSSRDDFIEFTRSYISFPEVIFTRKDSRFIAGLKDLSGRTVASENGFIEVDYLKRDIPQVKILETTTTEEALKSVATGKADAYVGNLAVASYLIEKKGFADLKVAAPALYPEDTYSMGVRKDWPELARLIDKALAAMSEDEHRQIRQKWLPVRYEHGLRTLDLVKWVAIVTAVLAVFILQLRRMVRQRTAELQESLSQLQDTHRKLADIIEFLPDATFVLDRDGRILAWNRAIEAMTGIPKEQMIGKGNYEDAIPFYGIARPVLADLVLSGASPDSGKYDEFSRHGDVVNVIGFTPALYGGRGAYVAATASPLKDSSGAIVGAIESLRDISALRAAETEIKLLNEQLELRVQQRTTELELAKAELSGMNDTLRLHSLSLEGANRKLEAFSYSVSHDLRAPLRHIDSYAKLLNEEYAAKLDSDGQHYLQRISASCRRMDVMITAMLDLARSSSQELQKVTVDPNHLVHEVLAELPQGQTSVSLQSLPPCQADPILLKQVYANLIGNALKFSRLQQGATVEIGSEDKDGTTVYFVRDNGIGFDMAHAGSLFGVFQRLQSSPDYDGVGVGLAIVQSIIERHGGRISAESRPGEGATFLFTLAS
jgi:PAS domain S-box-containing protein